MVARNRCQTKAEPDHVADFFRDPACNAELIEQFVCTCYSQKRAYQMVRALIEQYRGEFASELPELLVQLAFLDKENAEAFYNQAEEILKRTKGEGKLSLGYVLTQHGRFLLEHRRYGEASTVLRRAIAQTLSEPERKGQMNMKDALELKGVMDDVLEAQRCLKIQNTKNEPAPVCA